MREELFRRQIARLPPTEDRLGDIRREIAEADDIFQYRSAADGVGENAMPVLIKSGRSPSLIVRWIAALGPGSTKAQHNPLIVPGKRQA